MAFISLYSVLCKHKEFSVILCSSKVICISLSDWHSQLTSICKRLRWFLSAEFELLALKAAVGFPSHGASLPDNLPWLWCCGMTWHTKETVNPKQAQPQSSSVTPAQCSRLTGKHSLHSSVLSNLRKSSRTAVNTFTLQTSIIAPEIRSLLKF